LPDFAYAFDKLAQRGNGVRECSCILARIPQHNASIPAGCGEAQPAAARHRPQLHHCIGVRADAAAAAAAG